MSASYKVRYVSMAVSALEEEARYIEREFSRDRAAAWLRAMRDSIQKLETFPRAFATAGVRSGRPIHSKVVMSHRVYYVVNEATRIVDIIDVVHTARETRLSKYREP